MKLYFFGAIDPRVHQLQGATSDTERSSRAVTPKELRQRAQYAANAEPPQTPFCQAERSPQKRCCCKNVSRFVQGNGVGQDASVALEMSFYFYKASLPLTGGAPRHGAWVH